MYVKQKFSILFYRKMKKKTRDGKVPIYVRITIDGLSDEMSTGLKILPVHWNNSTKLADSGEPAYKAFNKKIGFIKADLERHFYLMQTKHGSVTPALVKESYMTPAFGQQKHNEKEENMCTDPLNSWTN
jgi:hypothetical protein